MGKRAGAARWARRRTHLINLAGNTAGNIMCVVACASQRGETPRGVLAGAGDERSLAEGRDEPSDAESQVQERE